MKLRLLIVLLVAGLTSSDRAQTTQPVLDGWTRALDRFSAALVANSGSAECKSLMADACLIRSFRSPTSTQLPDLLAHSSDAAVVMCKAYLFPSNSLAADISAAVLANNLIPDPEKRLLVIPEGDACVKANATADIWMQQALGATPGQPVGALVLYGRPLLNSGVPESQILFVLIKGEIYDVNHFRISQIVYGDPTQATAVLR